jgi:hypothetical protein
MTRTGREVWGFRPRREYTVSLSVNAMYGRKKVFRGKVSC